MKRYPRDMIGHGAKPPHASWPNGAKIAVQIVINYEEGGENNVLHVDAASEAFLSEIVGAAAWPDQRHRCILQQTVQTPETCARAVFIDGFHVPVPLIRPRRSADD